MRNTIPAGTWIFRSQVGTYNFHYPAEEREKTEVDLEVASTPPWPRMAGLTAFQLADSSIVWCEHGSVRAA